MRALRDQYEALGSAISGLEGILRLRGVDPGHGDEGSDTSSPVSAIKLKSSTSRLIAAVVAALNKTKEPLGAKALHRALLKGGIAANYYTLYKNLQREAVMNDGAVVRSGDKFGLREWATNGTDIDNR
jgi:hypothetical protein